MQQLWWIRNRNCNKNQKYKPNPLFSPSAQFLKIYYWTGIICIKFFAFDLILIIINIFINTSQISLTYHVLTIFNIKKWLLLFFYMIFRCGHTRTFFTMNHIKQRRQEKETNMTFFKKILQNNDMMKILSESCMDCSWHITYTWRLKPLEYCFPTD